jgi:hypothetical protein
VDQDGRSDIDVIDAKPGTLARTLARPYAPNAQRFAWSPDGKVITYLQGLQPGLNAYMQDHLVAMPAAGGEWHELTEKLDRAVSSYAFSGERTITIAVEDDGTSYPARLDAYSGAIAREAPAGPFVVSSVSSRAGHTALLRADDHSLAEVYALESGRLRKLTAHNDALLAELQLGAGRADPRESTREGTRGPCHGAARTSRSCR